MCGERNSSGDDEAAGDDEVGGSALARCPPAQTAEAQCLARAWDAAHPREPYVLFLLNRPPPHAMLNASPFVVVVGEEL